MNTCRHLLSFARFVSSVYLFLAPSASQDRLRVAQDREELAEASILRGLRYQPIGPTFHSGRIESVCSHESKPDTLWVAAGSGGLWHSEDRGLTFRDALAGRYTASMGSVEVAPSNPDVIWVGTGENLRANDYTTPGVGVLRSVDGGQTFTPAGLPDSHHIAALAVHPTDPDTALCAVMGPFVLPSPTRGVYLTEDGGKTWQHTKFADERTAAFDVAYHPEDPRIALAVLWSILGGDETALHRSIDGGKTWKKAGKGLPRPEVTGRIELDVSHTQPNTVYAIVLLRKDEGELEKGGHLFVSKDAGISFERVSESVLDGLSWAFADVRVSPSDPDEVWVLGVRLRHSVDGGKTFRIVSGDVFHLNPSRARTLHLDVCDLWIDPRHPEHLFLGGDGGVYLSRNRGASWEHRNNIPISEFYDITLHESGHPFTVYGGTQDNASVFGPARPLVGGRDAGFQYVWLDPWSGGDGFVTIPHPDDPNIVFFEAQFGDLRRKDMTTGRNARIKPGGRRIQTNWYTPYLLSPHDPNTIYYGANHVFRSRNRGSRFKQLGKPLTRSVQTKRRSRALSALAESPLKAGLLYAGTEKGVCHRSDDGGETWIDITASLPEGHVKRMVPSRHELDRVYVTISGIEEGFFTPQVFVSENRGATWKDLSQGLPQDATNVLLEDPEHPDLLYLGTDATVFASFDRGKTWAVLGKGLPIASVQDLELHRASGTLVVATHGRSAYTLDVRPLRPFLKEGHQEETLHVYEVPEAYLPRQLDFSRDVDETTLEPALMTWWQAQEGEARVRILDDKKRALFERKRRVERGFHQLSWDLVRTERGREGVYFVPGFVYHRPGRYIAEVTALGETRSAPFAIREAR